MDCFFCGGVVHPATGCQWSARVIACGRCTRDFWRWLKGHTNRKWGGVYFYDCAVTPRPAPPASLG